VEFVGQKGLELLAQMIGVLFAAIGEQEPI
jgi:small neutral amino acid transporter SnatA (MarC family)